jgi:HTH-type transcriptional regulator / antitoxin HipB
MVTKRSRTGKKVPAAPPPTLVASPTVFGEVVHAQRKQSGATLQTAAGLSGVGIRFLHELEHGKPTAALGKALQVAQRMGLEVWLIPRGQRP